MRPRTLVLVVRGLLAIGSGGRVFEAQGHQNATLRRPGVPSGTFRRTEMRGARLAEARNGIETLEIYDDGCITGRARRARPGVNW